MNDDIRLGVNGYRRVLISQDEGEILPVTLKDVTEDFYRCVVLVVSESKEFEVDGMKFRATCERIE